MSPNPHFDAGEVRRRALADVKTAAKTTARARDTFEARIVDALDAGCSSREVADAAGMSSPGVLGVRNRRAAS